MSVVQIMQSPPSDIAVPLEKPIFIKIYYSGGCRLEGFIVGYDSSGNLVIKHAYKINNMQHTKTYLGWTKVSPNILLTIARCGPPAA